MFFINDFCFAVVNKGKAVTKVADGKSSGKSYKTPAIPNRVTSKVQQVSHFCFEVFVTAEIENPAEKASDGKM